jgi:hypothetical protein
MGFGSSCTAPHVRFGSKADIGLLPTDVCFTPKSGHGSARRQRPLCAKSGHQNWLGFGSAQQLRQLDDTGYKSAGPDRLSDRPVTVPSFSRGCLALAWGGIVSRIPVRVTPLGSGPMAIDIARWQPHSAARRLILLLMLGLLLAFAPWAVATAEAQTTDPRVADLVRGGKLRVGLFLSQYGKGPDGLKTTVFVETARAYAARIGVPLVIVEHATPSEAIACLKAGSCDLFFCNSTHAQPRSEISRIQSSNWITP